jgi:HAD superfamily hydrolase (TIGR01509 family)
VPEQAEPPGPRQPGGRVDPASNGHTPGLVPPIEAVLFDFAGTLAQPESPVAWVQAAAEHCGRAIETGPATVLADRLVTAGRAAGPVPRRIPPHLIEVWAERDLYPHAHRAAYLGLAATVVDDDLAEALYERSASPGGWIAYADARGTLRALRERGIRIGVLSNIGFDIRPVLAAMDVADLVDAWVLSYELGRVKPDPAIFRAGCTALDTSPQHTLMVGDTPADAAATAIGCPAYLVPAADPGAVNGLAAVLALVGTTATDSR